MTYAGIPAAIEKVPRTYLETVSTPSACGVSDLRYALAIALKLMYPSDEVAATNDQPQAFITIEQCRKELTRVEAKLSPIMSGGGPEKTSNEAPVMNELDARLQQLLSHIRDISRRVKL